MKSNVKARQGDNTMSTHDENESSMSVRHAIMAVSIFGFVGALIALWLNGIRSARSVAIGAGFAVGNLWVLAQMVRVFLSRKGATVPWGIVALLRLFVLFGAMHVLVKARILDILPFTVGFAALPMGIVFAQLATAR